MKGVWSQGGVSEKTRRVKRFAEGVLSEPSRNTPSSGFFIDYILPTRTTARNRVVHHKEAHCSTLVVPLGEPAEWLQRLQVQLLPCVTASQPRLHFGCRLW